MASLGALVIELAANTARLQSDMGKAVSIAQAGARRFSTIFRGVAALAGAGSLGAVVAKAIETGDELNKAAIKAGITGRAMSELAHVARMSDVELSGLSNALRFMQTNLSKAASGAKEPRVALAALGLSVEKLAGMSADAQFEILAEQISRLKDPADKARVATELFGRAGADLLPLFEKGAAGIRAAREEAEKLGVSFSDQQIKKLADADDAIKRLRASWEGFATTLTSKVAPALSFTLDLASGRVFDQSTQNKIGNLEGQLAFFKKNLEVFERRGDAAAVARISERIRSIELDLYSLRTINDDFAARRSRAIGGAGDAVGYAAAQQSDETLTEIVVENARIRTDAMEAYYDSLEEESMTQMQRELRDFALIESALNERLRAGRITAQQYNEAWLEASNLTLQEIKVTHEKLGHTLIDSTGKLSEYALQAARNIQDAFAQFLFDPFADGLKGMLKGFIDTIRRMVAETAAAKIFSSKSSGGFGVSDLIGGFVDGLFGGNRAKGGPIEQGKWYIAGEHGPEPIWGGGAGAMAMGYGGGGNVFNINVDARYAQKGVAEQIAEQLRAVAPMLVRSSIDGARAAVRDDFSRGRMRA